MHSLKHTFPLRSLLPRWRRSALSWLALGGLALGAAGAAATGPTPAATPTIVLYDGGLRSPPNSQGWTYIANGGSTTLNPNGTVTLDTSGDKGTSAGYFAARGGFFGSTAPVPALDRAVGYTVSFTAQVELEDHAGSDRNSDKLDDRAGFSLIVISSDKRGIELGFWNDRIWAQEGGASQPPSGKLFTQAESAPFNTQAAITPYALAVQGDDYALSSNGAPILSGKLRDYTAFIGPLDPYDTPNLIFLGDDTSSASAKINLASVAVGPIAGAPPSLDRKLYVAQLDR